MKKSVLNLVAAACLAALGGVCCAAAASCVTYNNSDEIAEQYENNYPVHGMFFSVENVVEEYETDTELVIVYSDPDAGLWECPISVDAYTYTEVLHAIAHKNELVGQLVETDKPGVFTYMEEPEFEMAEASAKIKTIEPQKLTF